MKCSIDLHSEHVIVFAFFSLPPVRRVSSFLAVNPVHGKIAGVGSVESSFLFQVTRCVESFDHPDLAAIMVFLECLTTLEVREFTFGVGGGGEVEPPRFRTSLFRFPPGCVCCTKNLCLWQSHFLLAMIRPDIFHRVQYGAKFEAWDCHTVMRTYFFMSFCVCLIFF